MEPVAESAGKNWTLLYKAGGVSMLLIGLIYITGAVLSVVIGPAPSSAEAYLNAISTKTTLSRINFELFCLADLLLVPAALALYLALKGVNRNAMLAAAGLVLLFVALDLGVTELNSFALVKLTEDYATAMTEAQYATILASVKYALAMLSIGTFLRYVVSSAGVLIAGLVMRKGVFGKTAAYLGIATGVVGIVAGFYVVVPVLAVLLVPSLLMFGLWTMVSGLRLCNLGRRHHQPDFGQLHAPQFLTPEPARDADNAVLQSQPQEQVPSLPVADYP